MLLPKGTRKIKFSKSVEVGPSFGYFSITTEEGISCLTAPLKVCFVPQNKHRVTKEEHEGRQELPLRAGAGSDTGNAEVLALSRRVSSQVYTQSKYKSTQVSGQVLSGTIHK